MSSWISWGFLCRGNTAVLKRGCDEQHAQRVSHALALLIVASEALERKQFLFSFSVSYSRFPVFFFFTPASVEGPWFPSFFLSFFQVFVQHVIPFCFSFSLLLFFFFIIFFFSFHSRNIDDSPGKQCIVLQLVWWSLKKKKKKGVMHTHNYFKQIWETFLLGHLLC